MPYKIQKKKGARPYKIIKTSTGEVVGTSVTRKSAEASIRARYWGEHKNKLIRRK